MARHIPQEIEKRNSNSCDCAVNLMILGNSMLLRLVIKAISMTPFIKVKEMSRNTFVPSTSRSEDMTSRISVAIISCTRRNPTAILPYSELRSPLSDRSLRMMIVLEKVSAIATYNAEIFSRPINLAITYPIAEVNTTWPIPVASEIFPTSLITLGLRFNPTTNRSVVMPIFEKSSMVS